jgi:RNA polymerase sigma factor (sigma-70 family)
MDEKGTMKILIADDHGVLREGLRAMIEKDPEMQVIGEAGDGPAAVRLAGQLRPDIVIMDITMPRLNGIEATRQIVRNGPATKVVILSMHTEGHIIRETLAAGACGYVVKASLFDELARALRAVVRGEYYLSPRVSDVVVHEWVERSRRTVGRPVEALSSRERQILQLSAEGMAVKEIARKLHISPKTVHANRHRLMDKLGFSSLADLTKYALSQGVTSIEF